ncbi:transcriptional regulator, TetR family [Thalassovita taeanensis]|uniref:Transcriptional regulator, TetR family n=1 Tax=Thalassovita taeanensis TaxID=657014 RepID=A0A1H9J8J1_9RHOB|nr:transcriptional regulator, TetR family [Thalassovita taeanensis]
MPPRQTTSRASTSHAAALTKGEATAERILDAAFTSIATRGCGAVTLRGIADEAGVVLSQLSYYYGNKDSLFSAVMTRMQSGYIAALSERLQGLVSLEAQIIALIDYNEAILNDSPDTYRNFLEFSNVAMTSAPFQAEVADFTSQLATMIENCISNYEPKTTSVAGFPVAALARFILSASFGIALQCFLNPQNEDVRKGFAILKVTAVQLIAEDRAKQLKG